MDTKENLIKSIHKIDKSQTAEALLELSQDDLIILKVKTEMKRDKLGLMFFHKGNTLNKEKISNNKYKKRR